MNTSQMFWTNEEKIYLMLQYIYIMEGTLDLTSFCS